MLFYTSQLALGVSCHLRCHNTHEFRYFGHGQWPRYQEAPLTERQKTPSQVERPRSGSPTNSLNQIGASISREKLASRKMILTPVQYAWFLDKVLWREGPILSSAQIIITFCIMTIRERPHGSFVSLKVRYDGDTTQCGLLESYR